MSTLKSSAENLTLNADGAGNDIKFQSNGVEKASLTDGGVFTATSFAGSGAALTSVKAINAGRKNLIINGGMGIWQRATSFSVTTADTQLVDRFKTKHGSAFDLDTTITKSTDVPSGEGFSHSLQVDSDGTASLSGSENGGISYDIEGLDAQHLGYGNANAKDLTLSFWVKSNKPGTYSFQVQSKPTAGDGVYVLYSYAVTSGWTKVTINIPKNTTQSVINTNAAGLRLFWWLVTGPSDVAAATTVWTANPSPTYKGVSSQVNFMDSATNTFNITGVQLELGSVATDFEHRSYGEELTLCQRYYEIANQGIIGIPNSTTGFYACVNFKVRKRTTPTVSLAITNPTCIQWAIANRVASSASLATAYASATGGAYRIEGFSSITTGAPGGFIDADLLRFDAEL